MESTPGSLDYVGTGSVDGKAMGKSDRSSE